MAGTNLFGQTIQINNQAELLGFWEKKLCENPQFTIEEQNQPEFKGNNNLISIAQQLLVLLQDSATKDNFSTKGFLNLESQLEALNYNTAEAYVLYCLGRKLYALGRNTEGIEAILHAKEIIAYKNNTQGFPQIASFYYYLGKIHIDYGESELALNYLQQASQKTFCNAWDEYYCWGNIALTYFNLDNTVKAIEASQKALTIINKIGDSAEIASMMGNIGTIYQKHGDYKNALIYLEADYRASLNYKNWESTVAVLVMKAKSYNHLQQYDSAKLALNIADSIANVCQCLSSGAKKEYYEQLAKYFSKKGAWPNYSNAIDSFIYYSNLLNNNARNNTSNFLGTELKVVNRIHDTKMKLVESERQRQLLVRNFIIVLSLFVLLVVLFFLNNQRIKRSAEQKIYQLNLNNAKHQLDSYLENIRKKNQLLDELQQKLEASMLQKSQIQDAANIDHEQLELMAKLENASLITDEGWQEFTALVEQVHQHFFTKLNITFDNLTPAEIRLITLIKLRFSIKESAAMLGISADSVRKARYRLRKKLSLEDENSLEELIYGI